MFRSNEPGYVLVSQWDPSKRRGIWMRCSPAWTSIELCGGREGDDVNIFFKVGEAITLNHVLRLEEVLRREMSQFRNEIEAREDAMCWDFRAKSHAQLTGKKPTLVNFDMEMLSWKLRLPGGMSDQ